MALLGYSVPETLTDDAGNAMKGITVTVTGPSAYSGTATTNATTGVLRLGPLPPGDYTVTYGSRSVTVPIVVSLPSGGTTGQVIGLNGGTTPGWVDPPSSGQPLDSDLTTIAALDSSTAGVLSTDGAGWIRKTYAQLKTALALTKGDVGLGNVDNTSDVNKPVSTAVTAAIAAQATTDRGTYAPLDARDTSITSFTVGMLVSSGSSIYRVTTAHAAPFDSTKATQQGGTLLAPYSTSDAPAIGLYFPEAHGAVGDGVTSDTAAIQAAIDAAFAAGGGTVAFRAVTYYSPAALTPRDGVLMQGRRAVVEQQSNVTGTYLPDGVWNYTGGTLIKGNGTAAGFDDGQTDQGSLPANVGTTATIGASIALIGFDNVTYGIKCGAQNVMGLVWGSITDIYVRNATQWGVFLVNFQHMRIERITTTLCQNGQYYGVNGTPTAPGNSTLRELYNLTAQDGRDNRLCRGIVFEARNGGGLNELDCARVQNNGYGRSLLTVTATLTNTSTTVAVPDGTKFQVGMPVQAGTTIGGYTSNKIYVVASIAGNNLTLANDRRSTAITASAGGSLTLKTYGWPNIEITADSNSTSHVTSSRFRSLDLEGLYTVGLYVDNAVAIEADITEASGTSLVALCVRSSGTRFSSGNAITSDFDMASANGSVHSGALGTRYGITPRGLWYDTTMGGGVLNLTNNPPSGGDIQGRYAMLYPMTGLGEHITGRDTSRSLDGSFGGDILFSGAAGQTFTLPTIANDTSTPVNSVIGLWFEIFNVGANSVTVSTDGAQTFNKSAGKFTTTIAPGVSMKVIASRDASNVLFWAARQTSMTLP